MAICTVVLAVVALASQREQQRLDDARRNLEKLEHAINRYEAAKQNSVEQPRTEGDEGRSGQ